MNRAELSPLKVSRAGFCQSVVGRRVGSIILQGYPSAKGNSQEKGAALQKLVDEYSGLGEGICSGHQQNVIQGSSPRFCMIFRLIMAWGWQLGECKGMNGWHLGGTRVLIFRAHWQGQW